VAIKTPLYEQHLELGAKMTEFAGYLMPLQYSSIVSEHQVVRTTVGIFDLCHMGEILITGSGAQQFLNYLTTNNVANLVPGAIQYNLLTNASGGVVDDILVYRVPEGYYLVVNAANKDKDYQWLLAHATKDVHVQDLSEDTALVAVQGPNSIQVVEKIFNCSFADLRYYQFVDLMYNGMTVRISRTGYTGEDGFEIYMPLTAAVPLWRVLLTIGEPYQIQPIGLGARDTLRLEMRMSLYGHELTDATSPLEAGLERFVDFDKGEFLGREVLLKQKQEGIDRKLVGFVLKDRGISRHGYAITNGEKIIGHVTSGTISPSTGKSIGLGYVASEYAKVGKTIFIQIRQQQVPAQIIKGRFVSTKK